jgi:RNA polymerase sigma factor, sigma-70 family/RNA polymerase sigma-70 factor, Bacteroides expansion family 1
MKDKNAENSLVSFRSYYEANVSPLILFARCFVPEEMAEDIIQDVFLDIWDHSEVNEKLPSRSYLFMAVRNKCLNILIREQVKKNYIESTELDNRILGLDYYDSFEKQLIDKEDMQYVYDEIEKLPEKCRIIFKMAYFEEKKNAEIAEILDISIRTVEHHLYLGLKTLRTQCMDKRKKSLFFLFFF